MAKKTRRVSKVNLRKAYEAGGYRGDYSWFVREKVVPIIGESALHSAPSIPGSRVKEYKVTRKNLNRIMKSLGLSALNSIEKAVRSSDPKVTARIILDLIKDTEQPKPDKDFPLSFKLPIHPISHNMLYAINRGKWCRSDSYTKWRRRFFPMIQALDPKGDVDFKKPVEMHIKFGHREASDTGGYFDTQNFAKAAIDCVYEHFNSKDHLVSDLHISREFVNTYEEGYIEMKLGNI